MNQKKKPGDWRIVIIPIYQTGISLYFLVYLIFSWIMKISGKPIPVKTKWNFSFPSIKNSKPDLIWIHAVSGGEVKAARMLIETFLSPEDFYGKILLTYCSKTGEEMAKGVVQDHPDLLVSHLPIDFYPLTRKALKQIKNHFVLKKFIIIEHDFWPNWLSGVKEIGGERIGVNYFLKPRDHSRYRLFPPAYRFVHDLDILLTQNLNTTRMVEAFHPGFPVMAAGNLKYGLPAKPKKTNPKLKHQGITITLGSSHEGEEKLVLEALKNHLKNSKAMIRLIIIPRHPARSDKICRLLNGSGYSPKIFPHSHAGNLLVVNQMGWSEPLYAHSDIVLIGDTFIPSQGGHNFLEAMAAGTCVVYGPYMRNYADITAGLEKAEAVIRILPGDVKENLQNCLAELISDKRKRERMGKIGKAKFTDIQYDKKLYRETITIKK